jgi:hypothetical protein
LHFSDQVHQRCGGKDSVRLLGRRVMQHHRGGASSLNLSASACTSADVNVIGSRLAMMRSFFVTPVHFRLAINAHCRVHPTRCRSKAGLKSALAQAGFSP